MIYQAVLLCAGKTINILKMARINTANHKNAMCVKLFLGINRSALSSRHSKKKREK